MNRVGSTDTSAEARRILSDVYRRMAPSRKLQLQVADYRSERALHEAGRRSREPSATIGDIRRSWNLIRLGQGPWISEEEPPMDESLDNLGVVREVTSAFTRLGIPYALGGSWASSFHGEPRSTRDADITVEPFPGLESALVASFGPDYYVSLDAVERGHSRGPDVQHHQHGRRIQGRCLRPQRHPLRPFRHEPEGRGLDRGNPRLDPVHDLGRGHHPPQAGVVSAGRRNLRAPMVGCPRHPPNPGRPPRPCLPRSLGG